MKLQANKHSSDWAIEIGDWVYLKLQPYCQLLVKDSQNQKLSKRFYGPLQILQKIGSVAYKPNLPPS